MMMIINTSQILPHDGPDDPLASELHVNLLNDSEVVRRRQLHASSLSDGRYYRRDKMGSGDKKVPENQAASSLYPERPDLRSDFANTKSTFQPLHQRVRYAFSSVPVRYLTLEVLVF